MRLQITKARGHEYAAITQAYRDQEGRPRHRTIENLGRVDRLDAEDPGWRAAAQARAAKMTREKQDARGVVEYDTSAPSARLPTLNAGHLLVGAVWERLGLDAYLRGLRRDRGWGVDVGGVARTLVAARITWPGSKKAACEKACLMALTEEFPLKDAYRALDHLADVSARVQARCARLLDGGAVGPPAAVYYDVTNYFFAIDRGDDGPRGKDAPRGEATRQNGCSKEHRTSPIIQMGLFMDARGMPLRYRLFDGNVPDTSTLTAALGDFKAAAGTGKVVVVADKAMNTARNTAMLDERGDGWVFSASARQLDKRARAWMLDQDGWEWLDDDKTVRVKSRVIERVCEWKDDDGKRCRRTVTEKVIARWSKDYADRDAHTRADLLAKAAALVADPSKYKSVTGKGARKYVEEIAVDTKTGEVADPARVLLVDAARAEADAQLDGYWLVHTSLTETPDREVLDKYKELWRIEDTFRVSKTNLKARPVFVWTPAHIEAHFLVCFLALLIERLLESWTGLPSGQLCEAVRGLTVKPAGAGVFLVDRPEAWDRIDAAVGVTSDREWVTVEQLRAWRRDLTDATARLAT
ncbi:MAG: IS1634 family transposase [Propionibacteriaceae bacterium]|nr:IS1634 family transposase [Propionibacteriaceae bacterium]